MQDTSLVTKDPATESSPEPLTIPFKEGMVFDSNEKGVSAQIADLFDNPHCHFAISIDAYYLGNQRVELILVWRTRGLIGNKARLIGTSTDVRGIPRGPEVLIGTITPDDVEITFTRRKL